MEGRYDRWNRHFEEIMQFVRDNKRRPSKHNEEDHQMLCWIKYNKKKYARGLLSEEQMRKFDEYLVLANKYRRYNALTYAYPDIVSEELDLFVDNN